MLILGRNCIPKNRWERSWATVLATAVNKCILVSPTFDINLCFVENR